MNNLNKKIESIIFYKGEEMTFKEIAKLLDEKEDVVQNAVKEIKNRYLESGINIITTDTSVIMTTGADSSDIIEKLENEEYEKELTRASLETLTIILYRGPIKRSMIDFIRGVNSQFTLRNLLIRGLIEKVPDTNDERAYLYKPTIDLLRFLSISDINELQEYKEVNEKIDSFVNKPELDE